MFVLLIKSSEPAKSTTRSFVIVVVVWIAGGHLEIHAMQRDFMFWSFEFWNDLMTRILCL